MEESQRGSAEKLPFSPVEEQGRDRSVNRGGNTTLRFLRTVARFTWQIKKKKTNMCVASTPFCCKRDVNRERTKKFSLAIVFFFLAAFVSCAACPHGCVCSTTTVRCVNQDLLEIPQPLPANITALFVTGNNISRITSESFPTRLDQLTELNLTGNQLEAVDAMVFSNLPNLRLLDLSNNRILRFNASAFPVDSTVQELVLSGAFSNQSSTEEFLDLLQSGALRLLTHLDMSNNDLLVLPEGAFVHLSNLVSLSLQNSSIISIQDGALRVPPLRQLDLRDNILRVLPNATLDDLSLHPHLLLQLAGNPWRCDCNLEDLRAWLKRPDQPVGDLQSLTCAEPEDLRHRRLVDLQRAQLECSYSGDMNGVLETSYVFLGMVLALIGVIFLLVLYLNRRGIKRWVYNIRDACRDHMEGYHYRYEINSEPRMANLSINSDV